MWGALSKTGQLTTRAPLLAARQSGAGASKLCPTQPFSITSISSKDQGSFLRRCGLWSGLGALPQQGVIPQKVASPFSLGGFSVRWKQTKRESYHMPGRASPNTQAMPQRAHIGIKAVPSEYVEAGRVIVKQRKYIAKNPNVTRKRHFKLYPGVNVGVMKNTSLQALVSGRVKMTHDVKRDVLVMNVLAEPREELLREEMWRYRTEHVECMQENTVLCQLRAKATVVFGKEGGWINQPVGPKPMKVKISEKNDHWNNPNIQDPFDVEPFPYPLNRSLLARHIEKVRRRQAGVKDEDNDPEFDVTDTRFHLFKGQSAQR